jgi:hypothetical protein
VRAFSSQTFWSRFFKEFRCSRCGSQDGFVSRPRNLFERYALPFLAMRAARCGDCYHRSYHASRVPLLPHPEQHKFAPSGSVGTGDGAELKSTEKGTNGDHGDRQQIA